MSYATALPTYHTSAEVLEKKNGAGLRLVGWTVARAALIAAGVMVAGVPPKRALVGALISSGLISIYAVARIKQHAEANGTRAATTAS